MSGLQYSSGCVQGAGAVWHIWRREDLDQLRAFMRANQAAFPDVTTASGHVELAAWEDPVHSQRFMLTDALLQKLHEDTGVQPWQFEQNLGDAVIIPAGCAHQVRCRYGHAWCHLRLITHGDHASACLATVVPHSRHLLSHTNAFDGCVGEGEDM